MKQILILISSLLLAISIDAQIYLNEVIAANESLLADNYGEYDDLIEVYNASNSPINIAGYYLSDGLTASDKWQIPNTDPSSTTIASNGFLLLWADGDTEQGAHHLPFKLSSAGETLYLFDTDGVTLLQELTFSDLSKNESYGFASDGAGDFVYFSQGTPNGTNANGIAELVPPVIQTPNQQYTGSLSISITATSNTTIYYTTDGSEPDNSDYLYTNPFTIDSTAVVKAIAVRAGYENSTISTASYIHNLTTQLPILHISIDPKYLWSDEEGMYVTGTNGISGPCRTTLHNYNQDWEYQANAILYEKDGTMAFNEDCGLSISGGCSRGHDKKSFNVSFKGKYGATKLDYKLFENKEATEWEGFKIRSGSGRSTTYRMFDGYLQQVVEGEIDVDLQSTRPVVLYLNNEYWGLYNIRDRMNADYVTTHYPKIDSDNLDLIKFPLGGGIWHWINEEVKNGDSIAYHELHNFMADNDLSDISNYDYINSQVDINSFLDYFITNTYYNNLDWPGNNLKTWRERSPNGKWRWMMFDLDALIWRGGASSITLLDDMMNSVDNEAGQQNPTASMPFRSLMDNPEFKAEYIQRTNTYIHTIWDTIRVKGLYDEIKAEVSTEIQADFERWGGWDFNTWDTNYEYMYTYFVERPAYMRTMMDNVLGTNGRYQLNLNFNTSTKGKVVLHSNFYEVPYNYEGTYFTNVPIEIHAIPNPGYRFVRWQETGDTNANLYQSFTTNTTLTPIFEVAQDVVINEIHYHPEDTINNKEFIELYNPDSQAKDLSHYQFDSGVCFEFPRGTTIGAGEYLLIAADASQYQGNGYQVFEWESGSLDNNGEQLVLQNSIHITLDSVSFNDGDNWPFLSDGLGSSLELKYPVPDANDVATYWQSSAPIGGTPGKRNSTICNTLGNPVIINEINYDSDNINFDAGDWIELYNPSSTAVDLSNWRFYDEMNDFVIPTGTTLSPNEYLVLVEDKTTFAAQFPNVASTKIIGSLGFSLSNKGERISLFDANNCLVDEVIYNDKAPWPTTANGMGATLSLVHTGVDNAQAAHWKGSSDLSTFYPYGSPAKSNYCFGMTNELLCRQVSSSSDDAEELLSDGSMNLTSGDLDLVDDDGAVFIAGMRFQDIDLPKGATITSATIQFAADEVNTDSTVLIIKGQAADDASTFEATLNNISSRPSTNSSVTWKPKDWQSIGAQGIAQQTTDLSPIIQEIIDRPSFQAGNALAFLIEGTGIRTAESFDGAAALAPTLCITYSQNQCGVHAKVLLEGFYDAASDKMHTKLVDNNLLPLNQPFHTAPWNYNGTESVTTIPSGVTDWILVATRDNAGSILEQAAGFVNQAGELIGLDGLKGIPFPTAPGKRFSIHARSNLAVLSAQAYKEELYDFTTATTQAQGNEPLKFINGKYLLYSGDYDANGIINNTDFNQWKIQSALLNEYIPIDGDGNGIINAADYNLWINNRSKVGESVIRY